MELQQEHDVLEMFHEFWIVNFTVALNVSKQIERVAFGYCQAKNVLKAFQACLVLMELKE